MNKIAVLGKSGAGIGSTALALLLPKCPLCFAGWMWILSALGVSEVAYERWKLPLMMVILGFGVLMATRFFKPWVTGLLICAGGIALALKLNSDFELSAFPVIVWIMGMTVLTAVLNLIKVRKARACCEPTRAIA